MKKAHINVAFDEEKLSALEFSLKKKGSSIQAELAQTLAQLYAQTVPQPVREFLDNRAALQTRPRRPVRPRPTPKERPAASEQGDGA